MPASECLLQHHPAPGTPCALHPNVLADSASVLAVGLRVRERLQQAQSYPAIQDETRRPEFEHPTRLLAILLKRLMRSSLSSRQVSMMGRDVSTILGGSERSEIGSRMSEWKLTQATGATSQIYTEYRVYCTACPIGEDLIRYLTNDHPFHFSFSPSALPPLVRRDFPNYRRATDTSENETQ